ncbi:MAG TPA: 4-(cytidine 5'-diphospho)-2-C-methyl-D-erythritol kinase [Gammaproteobacteria bacterium]|nr:4-(cytidine 5'-diphospho)-2-C-methyl-D-erythritol kinase [Gammaproteobacteria bacterium]
MPQDPAQFTWPAPAKLNLFLHITGRRDDGFHELQTLFQFLDRGDRLRFAPRGDGAIVRHGGLAAVPAEDDLVVRAARALQARCGTDSGVDIWLEKVLPAGGGLGGGSSDAATTLVALNALWDCGLGVAELARLGLELGADVPVFVRGEAAWAEGVGEQLAPVAGLGVDLPEPWYVVLAPPVSVSTAEIFSDPALIRDCPAIKIRDFLAGQVSNVCEKVVFRRYPEVARAQGELARFAPARMTGTGACIFAAFDDEAAAREAAKALAGRWPLLVARGRNRSPLQTALATWRAQAGAGN